VNFKATKIYNNLSRYILDVTCVIFRHKIWFQHFCVFEVLEGVSSIFIFTETIQCTLLGHGFKCVCLMFRLKYFQMCFKRTIITTF